MLTVEPPPTSPPSHPHEIPAVAALESALQTAFPSLDAPQDALAQLADLPADPRLLAVAPRPSLVSLDELIRQLSRCPILIIRKVGVPVATLFAIVTALFLHLSVLGAFLLAAYLGLLQPVHRHGNDTILGEEGGSGEGYMILGDAPQGPPTLAGVVDNLLAHAPSQLSDFNSQISAVPDGLTAARLAAEDLATTPPAPDTIGLANLQPQTGQLKPQSAAAIKRATLVVEPPGANSSSKTLANATLASAGRTGPVAASPFGGIGDGGGIDEGPLTPIRKPDKNGNGNGHGGKTGDGIDRGDSGANNRHPQLLEWGDFKLPDSVLRNPPAHNPVYEVTVLADGTPDKNSIHLVQSCGVKEIDELWKSALLHSKFRPAYAAGKPYAESDTFTCVINPEEK